MAMTPLERDAEHVAEINNLVDRLRNQSERFVPYVHQDHGGIHAPVLSVLRDPGRATGSTDVLCTDNPDATSRRQRELMKVTQLAKRDLCPWNAYPFDHDVKRDGDLTPEAIARGAVVLTEILSLMTDLKVLLLQGVDARWAWAMVHAFRSRWANPSFEVVMTCHPLGTRAKTAEGIEKNKAVQLAAWQRAADVVQAARRSGLGNS